ncbi:MAG: hypothetical protein WAU74_27380 [Pseudolabrys sp.]
MSRIEWVPELVAAPNLGRLGFPELLDVLSFPVVAGLAHRTQPIEWRIGVAAGLDRRHVVDSRGGLDPADV